VWHDEKTNVGLGSEQTFFDQQSSDDYSSITSIAHLGFFFSLPTAWRTPYLNASAGL
jgi:hypothetical protein